ncbi:MAG: Response regulator receiver protein [uncultured bacterium]|nr:MAG: Response regulator receiver protein [uncultured bacterium]
MKKTILLAEDEKVERMAISARFKMEGLQVLEAENGEEGLKLALDKHPDFILSDIKMPKMTGIEMITSIRQSGDWGKKVPILMLTGVVEAESIAKIVEQGVHDYIIKGAMDMDDVVKKIKEKLA